MADEIVRIGFGGWQLKELDGDGVKRVSAMELGKRLAYDPVNPASFKKKVIERLIKEGKLSKFDVKEELLLRHIGVTTRKFKYYWLTPKAAVRVTLEVRTHTAKEIHAKVVDQLESLQAALAAALPAPVLESPSGETAIVAAVERAMTRHTEELSKKLSKAITKGIARAMRAVVAPLARTANSLYVDEDRRAELIYVARQIVRARPKPRRTTLTAIWDGIRESPRNRFRPGKLFSTVWIDKFDPVLNSLYEQLTLADKEEKELAEKELAEKELAEKELAEKARVEAEKAAEAQKTDNVRSINSKKRS